MAQLMFGWFSRRICRDRGHRVELGGAARALEAAMLCHELVRPAASGPGGGETAHHMPITIWSADTGDGEGMWPTILGPLHELVGGLSEASIRSLPSDTFIHAHASGRRALTGVPESSGPHVTAFGPCS
jgi:hypothetical protein